jgi:hypothetical protein
MRTILLVIVFAAPVLLGGCAGGNLQGSSLLPSTSQAVHAHYNLDSVGGGPPSVKANGRVSHNTDSVGAGPPKALGAFAQSSDSVGGGPPALPGQKTDSVGGGPPMKHTKMHHNSGDSVGGGPPYRH